MTKIKPVEGSCKDPFNYDNLKLVETPESDRNTGRLLPQNLEGCEGYLVTLPLRAPNVDQKIPKTIAIMVNVSTVSNSEALFAQEEKRTTDVPEERREGAPLKIYNPSTSHVMKKLISSCGSCHIPAPGLLGHVVKPGCISFYKKDGKIYAAPEGRWLLSSYKAGWLQKTNISLDQDQIKVEQVLIIRVSPGSVGRVMDQGNPILLDVGTHVFNSGTITNVGTVEYAEREYFNHGKYHYVRVPRGKYAKVWVEYKGRNGMKSVVPRLLAEGEHVLESFLFQYKGLCNVGEEYIQHGSIHAISVQKGFVAKVFHENLPRLLGEGNHMIESPQFLYQGIENIITSSCTAP